MKKLIDKLGIADLSVVQPIQDITLVDADKSEEKTYAAQNIKSVIVNAMVSLPKVTTTLEDNPSPRMIEATANFYKMVVELNEAYYKLSQEVLPEQNVTNNNIAIFSTEELIDKVRQQLKV